MDFLIFSTKVCEKNPSVTCGLIFCYRFLIEEMMSKHALIDGFSESLLRSGAITIGTSSEKTETSMCRC